MIQTSTMVENVTYEAPKGFRVRLFGKRKVRIVPSTRHTRTRVARPALQAETQVARAAVWLTEHFKAESTQESAAVQAAGELQGFSRKVIQRAAFRLGASYSHPVIPGAWYMTLPAVSGVSPV